MDRFWSSPTSLCVCCCECVRQWHHFSCSRAGMLMFQPMACRSKPQVNRLHDWFSSFHAVQHTIRLWPYTHTHTHTERCRMLVLMTSSDESNTRLPPPLTILLLRGSLASLTPLMSNSRTCRLSCGRAMILWLAETLILKHHIEFSFNPISIVNSSLISCTTAVG